VCDAIAGPYRQANQLPFQIEKLIVQLKRERRSWGGLSKLSVWRLLLVSTSSASSPAIRSRMAATVFAVAGQYVGIKEVGDRIWLVCSIDYDLEFFYHETGRLDSAENPFAAKCYPCFRYKPLLCVRNGPALIWLPESGKDGHWSEVLSMP